MASDEALYNTLFNGAYLNPIQPLWLSYTSTNITGPDLAVSTLTVNPYPAGNILLQSDTVSGTEYRAPLIFQRPVGDINAPSESLQMNLSVNVPTYPVDGEFITATKAAGTAYDDIAVKGLQIFGDQTTSGNSGATAYITGSNGNLILSPHDSVYVSSLFVSTLTANTIISTSATTGTSLTLTSFLSSATVITGNISTNSISTSQIRAQDIFTSTLTVSTLNAPNFVVSTINTSNVSSISIDTKVTLTSTLTLFGISSVSLGLGDVIQGLVGGAASQGLGAVLGGAALATGVAALVTGRTSGGVNSNVFQTVNGSTQLQFSTIGSAVSSVFLTTNSALPLTTPGVPIRQEIGVPAGTLCIRSVGDPLNIVNNISAIQMFGQWVPVPSGGGGSNFTIPSTIALSSITVNGNLTQSGTGTFNWGGNTMSPTQVVLARPTSVNNTLTTTGTAFLNASATVNAGLTVASGGMFVSGFTSLTGGASVLNGLNVASGTTTFANQVNINQNATVFGGLTVNSGSLFYGGVIMPSGGFTMQQFGAIASIPILNAGLSIKSPTISTTNISTANINLSSINGATYPPPGTGGLPSTLQVSTLTVNGGQTITNGALIVTSGGISVVTNGINVGSGNVLIQDAISVNGLATLNGGVNTTNINLNTINGAPYSPGGGGGGIPSTILASTILFNGGLSNTGSAPLFSVDINTTNLRASDINLSNNGGKIDGGGQLSFQLAPGASKHTFRDSTGTNTGFIADFYADKTSRFFSTVTVRDTTWPIVGPSFARLQTYDPSYDSQPWGSVLTSNLSSVTANFNTGFASLMNAASISTINVNARFMTASTIQTSSITTNGMQMNTNLQIFQGTGQPLPLAEYQAFGNNLVTSVATNAGSVIWQSGYGGGAAPILALNVANQSSRMYGTLTVRDTNAVNQANIQTYNRGGEPPMGQVFTSTISTVTLNSFTGIISSLTVSSINNAIYPPLSIPTGGIMIWGGTVVGTIPIGWLICDGSLVSKTTYTNLYAAIGDSYYNGKTTGVPYDSNSFFLPDMTFAIPQGAPTPTYSCSVFAVTYPYSVSGYPPPVSSNSYWALGVQGNQTAGTINIGTYFPPGSVPGAPAGIGYRITRILGFGFDGNPDVIEVNADDNSAVPYISSLTTISSIGVYRDNGTSPLKYWMPGTFNDNYQGNPPTIPLVQPVRNLFRQLDATNIPAHQHYGVPSVETTALAGASFLGGSPSLPGTLTSVQPGATKLNNAYVPAPYPTKPHVMNMYYIIRT